MKICGKRSTLSSVIWRERNQKRIEKIGATIILGAAELFLLFALYYFLAPWEVAYRQQGAATGRAQLDALPVLSTDRRLDVSSTSADGIDVDEQYSRQESCETVLDHHREVAPAQGWTFVWREPTGSVTIHHYGGMFGGVFHATHRGL